MALGFMCEVHGDFFKVRFPPYDVSEKGKIYADGRQGWSFVSRHISLF